MRWMRPRHGVRPGDDAVPRAQPVPEEAKRWMRREQARAAMVIERARAELEAAAVERQQQRGQR